MLQYGDLPDPVAGPGEVVVDVAAASVNGADWKVRAGDYGQAKFPRCPAAIFPAGRCRGPGVDDLKTGDAVFGVLEAGREGAYAEKLAIKAAIIARSLGALSHVESAALALTGLTAIVSIETRWSSSGAKKSSSRAAPAEWRASPSSSPSTSALT